jgi:TolB-like protein
MKADGSVSISSPSTPNVAPSPGGQGQQVEVTVGRMNTLSTQRYYTPAVTQNRLPVYVFDEFRLDPEKPLLQHRGHAVLLPNKALRLLLLLVQRRGSVVTKAEIFNTLWPDVTVEESNLLQTVYLLRKALGEEADRKYIDAVPRVGYRFVGVVQDVWDPSVSFWTSNESKGRIAGRQFPAVAVLPFTTLGDVDGREHLSIGFADVLITKLTKVEQLAVRPTHSILKYSAADAAVAGRELQVDAVFTGTIQVLHGRMRVTIQLISSVDGQPLWADKFDEESAHTFRAQDAVAERVVGALQLQMRLGVRDKAGRRAAEAVRVQEAYKRAGHFFNKRDRTSLVRGIDYFRTAIEMDPEFAPAYAGLAGSYARLGALEPGTAEVLECYHRAKTAALKALELDPDLAAAHAVAGHIRFLYERDMEGAEAKFKRALDLDPSEATSRLWYHVLLVCVGRIDEAFGQIREAHKSDPVSSLVSGNLGYIYYLRRDYETALDFTRKSLEVEGWHPWLNTLEVWILEQLGRHDEAVRRCEQNMARPGEGLFQTLDRGTAGRLLASAGDAAGARRLIRELKARPAQAPGTGYAAGLIHLALGEVRRATTSFREELVCREQSGWLLFEEILLSFMRYDPALDVLREAPEYRHLLEDYIAFLESRTVLRN